jgi:hypothetical protein
MTDREPSSDAPIDRAALLAHLTNLSITE